MGDVDRDDFFQITTYMSHFAHLRGNQLVLGGLLYPLGAPPEAGLCHNRWMDDERTVFIVDGIRVPEGKGAEFTDVLAAEQAFVGRRSLLLDAPH